MRQKNFTDPITDSMFNPYQRVTIPRPVSSSSNYSSIDDCIISNRNRRYIAPVLPKVEGNPLSRSQMSGVINRGYAASSRPSEGYVHQKYIHQNNTSSYHKQYERSKLSRFLTNALYLVASAFLMSVATYKVGELCFFRLRTETTIQEKKSENLISEKRQKKYLSGIYMSKDYRSKDYKPKNNSGGSFSRGSRRHRSRGNLGSHVRKHYRTKNKYHHHRISIRKKVKKKKAVIIAKPSGGIPIVYEGVQLSDKHIVSCYKAFDPNRDSIDGAVNR